MKILFINQYYYPDHSASSQFLTDLAEHLAGDGHDVTVLCSRSGYDGGVIGPKRERRNGVAIRRVSACAYGKRSMGGRMADYLSYYVLASIKALFFLPRYDVAIALTTPPLIAFLGRLLKLFRGTRFVYWLMDSYPAMAVQYGMLHPSGWTTRLFGGIALAALRGADAVVVLGECMRRHVRALGIAPRHIVTIDNWADCSDIVPTLKSENPLAWQHGLRDKFVVAYSGNMGLCHCFETILDGAERLQNYPDIVFLFIGGGKRCGEIEQRVEERGLSNVRFLPYQKREYLHWSLTLGDVHLISQQASVTGLIVSSKLYGILATGAPAVLVGPEDTQIGQIILKGRCGAVFAEGQTDAFAECLETLYRDTALRERMGHNARRICETYFDVRHGLARWQATLAHVIDPQERGKPLPSGIGVPAVERIGPGDTEPLDETPKRKRRPPRKEASP